MLNAIIEAVHGMAAVAWVGGIFFAYMALRPAANKTLEPPLRLRLWQSAYTHFFPWVWVMIALLLITGYADLFSRLGGLANESLYLKLMHSIGLFMVAAFAYLYFALYRRLSAAVASDDTLAAAAVMLRMRPVMATNLVLGLIVTAIGIAGPALAAA
ncbi:MAG: hypothetical protein KDI82_01295 [Gammaproteobacteria bacterium]|nr:hypothetical protein [Gammaproteobacteria bacterium]